ncbi:hypothetical protein KIW84_065652 [Lathyrus oleraceus]|uniref:Cyclin C-terminal domain-containing protein n=1 Tax=Pisum sativum TaxID=3888 RepID=A0A9D4WDN3_PEA|nr:hypothetical protein KIW84_065652 [Pisum sativum]
MFVSLSLFVISNASGVGVYLAEADFFFCRLRSSLWLQFKPDQIAAGAAYLAAKFLNMDLSAYQNIWQEFQATPSILQDVSQQLMELF